MKTYTSLLRGGFVARARTGFLAAAVTLAVMAASASFAAPDIVIESPPPEVIADGGDLASFGDHTVGSVALVKTLTVRNTGDAVLNLGAATFTGAAAGDFTADLSGADLTVDPGGSTTFTVAFAATRRGGREATLQLASNDPDESPYDVHVSGNGLACDVSVESGGDEIPNPSGSKDFGSVSVGLGSGTYFFQLKNTGEVDLNLNSITVGGDNPGDFQVVSEFTSPVVGPYGSFSYFWITFYPTAGGTRSAVVSVKTDDVDEPDYRFTITGTGVPVPEIRTENAEGGEIFYQDFGGVEPGDTIGPVEITIRNSGTANLNLGTLVLAGDNPEAYQLDISGTAAVVSPGGTTKFKVTFHPTDIGYKAAVVKIPSDDADEGLLQFFLSGYSTHMAETYVDWAAAAGLEEEDSWTDAEPYHDGVANLLKYAFNMNGGGPDVHVMAADTGTSGLPRWSLISGGPLGHYLRVEYVRRKGAMISYDVMISEDLENWDFPTVPHNATVIDDDWERITHDIPVDLEETPRMFGRVVVNEFVPA
ncbi:choice-of-anchor D domain-containing protein [Luteolibacter soli]|uniref:Choice-of-anchor D domain-containing protein n=1 Tax=Luteolibacter soli TaxID=3135280 RepID=A0ABU9B150_9BACT